MNRKETLSLDEFATAPRKQRADLMHGLDRDMDNNLGQREQPPELAARTHPEKAETSTEASKALRQMKRARMKGANQFVNVHLDRDTKRRLKLASFNMDTSMQAIMEKAIRQYLDANGF